MSLINIQGIMSNFIQKAKSNFCQAYRVNRFEEQIKNWYVARLNIRAVLFYSRSPAPFLRVLRHPSKGSGEMSMTFFSEKLPTLASVNWYLILSHEVTILEWLFLATD